MNKVEVNGKEILILSPPFFLASKFETFHNRGNDPRTSHDFEDIVYIFDNRKQLSDDLKNAPKIVHQYLAEQVGIILSNSVY